MWRGAPAISRGFSHRPTPSLQCTVRLVRLRSRDACVARDHIAQLLQYRQPLSRSERSIDRQDPAPLAMGDEEALTISARKRCLGVTVQYATGSRASLFFSGC